MRFSVTPEQIRLYRSILKDVEEKSRFLESKQWIQHGTTTIYQHSQSVALYCLNLANKFKWKIDEASMIRGALLHDYFLYDWHDKKARKNPHGYVHPGIALKNARQVFELNKIESDIIKHHMFPLTLCPPFTKEGFLITLADKICSIKETFNK